MRESSRDQCYVPFFFLFIDLTDNIDSEMCLFADDSSMFSCVKGVRQTHHKLIKDLVRITSWYQTSY